jgi:hypothetical protein
MKRFLALILFIGAPLHHSDAQESNQNQVLMFGGGISCSTWLTQNYESGKAWIWGHWTCRNIGAVVSGAGGVIGHTTDQNGNGRSVRRVMPETRFDPPILLNREALANLPKKIATRRQAVALLHELPPCGILWCGVAACLETYRTYLP